MPIPFVVAKRYRGQRVTSWLQPDARNQQESKSRQSSCQVQPLENIETDPRRDLFFVYELSYRVCLLSCHVMSGVLPVFQSLPVLQATEKTVVLPIRQKSSKVTPFFYGLQYWRAIRTNRKVTRRLRYFQHVITMTINITTSYH